MRTQMRICLQARTQECSRQPQGSRRAACAA